MTSQTTTSGGGQVAAAGCCGGGGRGAPASVEDGDIRAVVREKYGAIATGATSGCGCGCGEPGAAAEIGYTSEQVAAVPEGADLGLGCGNPLAHAALREGEVVLDLGSGAGIDCFLAARAVGAQGRVIGVDMTPAMIERARASAARAGAAHVEFRLGEIESLPVADATVDAVISNCVINLSPDKRRVFAEAFRVLRPGGRFVISDLVLERELPEAARRSVELYVGCVAGAPLKHQLLEHARAAGFRDVEIVEERRYAVGGGRLPEGSVERAAFEAVTSVKVRGYKPS